MGAIRTLAEALTQGWHGTPTMLEERHWDGWMDRRKVELFGGESSG